MNNKPNIAVISGGDSSEYIVSVKSGKHVLSVVDTEKYTPWLVEMKEKEWWVIQNDQKVAAIDKADFSFTLEKERIHFDFAYITIHGTPGEDGILQGYLDLLKTPYSTCDVHSSALTFNKWFCSNYLRSFGVKMARSVKLTKGTKINTSQLVEELGLPVFVKPNAGGSSFGITKVKEEGELKAAIKKAWTESNEALIEEFISGQEFTCGMVKIKDKEFIFPITEVLPKNEFFDYEAKYTPGAAKEITPARLPEDLFDECQQLTSQIYNFCRCSGICRIDFILKDNTFYFLEVNTTPGMTETSFIPQQINAAGFTLKEIISLIIQAKLEK